MKHPTIRQLTTKTLRALLVVALSLGAASASAQILYSNDFSSTGLPNADAPFTLDSENGFFNYVDNAPAGLNPTATASVQVSGVGGASFIVSSRFILNVNGADTANLSTVGFGLFGSSANFLSTSGQSYYLADWGVNSSSGTGNKGQLRIVALGDTSDASVGTNGDSDGDNPNGSSIVNGNTYELRLTGVFNAGSLSMTLALFDGDGIQLGTAATRTDDSPLTGEFFGYRNRLVNTSGTTDISFDDFSVALVPEPTSLSLAILALGTVICFRRRKV